MTSFVDEHREGYGVEPICAMLQIVPSTYYEQKARQADPSRLPERVRRDAVLCEEVERVWRENRRLYGARKIWRQLRRENIKVARCTVGEGGGWASRGPFGVESFGQRSPTRRRLVQRTWCNVTSLPLSRTSCG
ncbi:IS3 family transposase [Candidatus Bipolaricaulota bacterium]|nr:IS3 family transposase [Candidatus Bipolaricaulota bacterium]